MIDITCSPYIQRTIKGYKIKDTKNPQSRIKENYEVSITCREKRFIISKDFVCGYFLIKLLSID